MAARPFFALALTLWSAGLALDAGRAWVATTPLPPLGMETSVEVLDRDGRLLRPYQVADGRWRMTPGAVDPGYLAMLVAFEDKRFYEHAGVDWRAVARAVRQAVVSRRVVSGGSTLTMQVARLLEGSGTGRLAGKLRQARLALALEQRLTKAEILDLYLHLAPFGGNLEGVRAASLAYFGKEPRRLTPAESALLVALPQSPEGRRPDRRPEAAEAARAKVLRRAVGAGIISADQAQAGLTEAVPRARRPVPMLAPHLADRVLADAPLARRHVLTLDARLQARIEALAREAVEGRGERLQVAIMVADHRSGEILASVGSAAYKADARQGFVDMTQALRSPGSTLKPLIYGLAFDEGLAHPETLITDAPVDFDGYRPQNFDRQWRGEIRVREALQLSLNIPAVLLTEALGPARLLAALRRAGAEPVMPGGQPGLAVALGGLGLSLQDMVQLYGGIAAGGRGVRLHVRAGDAAPVRLIGPVAAWEVAQILGGTAPPAGLPANGLAYKTGTSYGNRDAWAIGFDGAHVVGVWMGRADGTPIPGAMGVDLAAPVLFRAFARLSRALVPLAAPPAGALTLANADLPQPLQRFRSRTAAFEDQSGPRVAFPPDGAEVEAMSDGVLLRVAGGVGPFTWLADGRVLVAGERGRDAVVALPGPGFVVLSVIDAAGRSARVSVRLR